MKKDDFDTEEDVGELKISKMDIVIFGEMLAFNKKTIDPFFTRGGPLSLDVSFFSQSEP